ncbi:clathrin light chain CLC1 NDAI_0D02090 [Naumovozyma dairenensis CBS 421]|uniref:Clathrin light chain n=1 Tax=Naumovozyma dairenensis (strain ATCC 10597 / BCRC 20456 / CBS 421 / NBRC 0211 / NRRL Y-12639) TaxID=1071378 RepID=G0W9R2_NAUDC|nr:hypothetical protein NDAI_0D02090 [Naumovozyma dairenensis CBS 421]CCD24523.1 hypothetical protein NDAI_0D02090 [Naumovozyma dairenensis CBS 421]
MSDKFPALDHDEQIIPDDVSDDNNINNDVEVSNDNENNDETAFLKREAEVLGDEFKTEQDDDLLDPVDAHEEIENFQDQYPDINDVSAGNVDINENIVKNESHLESATKSQQATPSGPSEAVTQWRENRANAIREKDEADYKEKASLQEEATEYILNFYEEYNAKKEKQIEITQKESEEFLQHRDEFFAQDNTTWDRVLQLINLDDADVFAGRDRSKFKEILLKLKGKTEVPGA